MESSRPLQRAAAQLQTRQASAVRELRLAIDGSTQNKGNGPYHLIHATGGTLASSITGLAAIRFATSH